MQIYNNTNLYTNTIKLSNMLAISFQLTTECNLKCAYCYQTNKSHKKMSFDVAQTFIDKLLQNQFKNFIDINNYDLIKLDFIGGEPLLEINLIEQIADYFVQQVTKLHHKWQYKYIFGITTNGTLYFNPKVQTFLKKYYHNLFISFSIDGNEQSHNTNRKFLNDNNSFAQVIKAKQHYMQTFNPNLPIQTITISPNNLIYLFDSIKYFIEELKETEIIISTIFEEGWTLAHAQLLYKELKSISDYLLTNNLEKEIIINIFDEYGYCPLSHDDINLLCGACSNNTIFINYNGDIVPCIRWAETSLDNNFNFCKVGNVYTGFLYNQQEINFNSKLKQLNRIDYSPSQCIDCKIAADCSSCLAYDYKINNNLNTRTIYTCIMHQAKSLANVYFWNNYYRKHNEFKRFKLWLEEEKALLIISKEELELLKQLQYPII